MALLPDDPWEGVTLEFDIVTVSSPPSFTPFLWIDSDPTRIYLALTGNLNATVYIARRQGIVDAGTGMGLSVFPGTWYEWWWDRHGMIVQEPVYADPDNDFAELYLEYLSVRGLKNPERDLERFLQSRTEAFQTVDSILKRAGRTDGRRPVEGGGSVPPIQALRR